MMRAVVHNNIDPDIAERNESDVALEDAYLFPASFGQERLWFLHQLDPSSTHYNSCTVMRLEGELSQDVLGKSLHEMIRRHEILRTTFSLVDNEVMQVVKPIESLAFEHITWDSIKDLRRYSEAEQTQYIQAMTTTEIQRPFDLSTGPLMRSYLLQLNDGVHLFIIIRHHIISDAWSTAIFFRELSTLYTAFKAGHPPTLPELPIQYADFAVWQRAWFQGEELEPQLTYWKKRLEHIPSVLNLPTDRPRPPVQTFSGARQIFKLPQPLTEALNDLSQKESTTLFMTLLAAFKVLLYRYTSQDHIVVGSPIANRNRAELEGLIGFFVNTLVLQTDLSGEPSFRALLARVREVALGAYAHQDLPFEKLVEELQPERSLNHSPLFQVMFVLQNAADKVGVTLPKVRTTVEPIDKGTAKFDLTLFMVEDKGRLHGIFEYNTDLFEVTTIERMAGHFQTLLNSVVTEPEIPISQLPLLTEAEQHQLLVEWNDTKIDYPSQATIHQLFEDQVERTPDAVALMFANQALTYRQLNTQANQLAHYLQNLGVRPESRVGLYFERSLEMIVAVLGVLKAGGAYVPLDPTYPQERLRFMITDAQIQVLLSQQSLADDHPNLFAGDIICLDDCQDIVAHKTKQNPVSGITSNNLAYVLYTSGSTGKPKGVAMPHRPLVNLIEWHRQHPILGQPVRTAQYTTLSFDVSFQEIFTTWCVGGTLILVDNATRRDPATLIQFLNQAEIKRLFLPFVALQHLAEVSDQWNMLPDSLNHIITAGEQLRITPAIARLCRQLDCTLHNHFGPTEAHVVTAHTLSEPVDQWPSLPPIGRPINNAQIYILDQFLKPVPCGIPGELYIGGEPLARGYLNQPTLTTEKFIPNPFGEGRLYRTGDLARYLSNGNIEFIGRADHQVKIRGYRVELGEIEAVLAQHPAITETVVVDQEEMTGDKRLITYFTTNKALNNQELRIFLKQKLPDYMIPAVFINLAQLPLTPNGKVDRQALPTPEKTRPDLEDSFVAPQTPVTRDLANIWSDLLKLDQVGLHDDFFTLGGHSLLAIHLIARIQTAFKVQLSVVDLFKSPTIDAQADIVSKLLAAQATYTPATTSLRQIQAGNAAYPPLLIVPGGGGGEDEFLIYAQLIHRLGTTQSIYGFFARGQDGYTQPHTSLAAMIEDYLQEIRQLQPSGPYFLSGECIGGRIAYELACRLDAAGETVTLILLDTKLQATAAWRPPRTYWLGRVTYHWEQVQKHQGAHKMHYLLKTLKASPLNPAIVLKTDFQKERQMLRARVGYTQLLRSHIPIDSFKQPIILIVSEDRHNCSTTMGVDDWAAGGLTVYPVPGNHDSYLGSHVETTAQQMSQCLQTSLTQLQLGGSQQGATNA